MDKYIGARKETDGLGGKMRLKYEKPIHYMVLPLCVLALFSCARNGRDYDWGASCSEIKRNHREISKIEKKMGALQEAERSDKRDAEMEYLQKRKRMLLQSNDKLQVDCRPIY